MKTFSIGFHAIDYDEAEYAKGVAAHLRTDHTEFYVEPRHALDVIPRLPDWFDEPFADPSQIPTYLVSELTRKHVTVALSGDGGDELFAGYNRYFWAERLARAGSACRARCAAPRPAAAHAFARRLEPAVGIVPASWRRRWPATSCTRSRPARESQAGCDLPAPGQPMGEARRDRRRGPRAARAAVGRDRRAGFPAFVPRMQYLDLVSYLPDDILTKVDRATMAVGLEGRVPLLDHRVVAYAWTLPFPFKVRGGSGKWLLRRVLDRYVPRPLIDRPKMGFGVPIDAWLRGPLREWAEPLLAPARLSSYGFVRVEPVRRAWQEHLEGSRNWQYPLWTVLMLQAWRERWA